MPVNSTGRKYLTDLLKGRDSFNTDNAVRYEFDTQVVTGAGAVDNIGIPVIWNDGSGYFEPYVAQDIAAAISTGGSPLADGSVIALTVGSAFGLGHNKEDTDISVADTEMTLLFRGPSAVVNEGVVWGAAAAPAQALFVAQLEAQGITFIDNAEVVSPTYQ